jgi:hypothetical protein
VPDSLRSLPFSARFPRLGRVGIHLVRKEGACPETVSRLVDYVSAMVG